MKNGPLPKVGKWHISLSMIWACCIIPRWNWALSIVHMDHITLSTTLGYVICQPGNFGNPCWKVEHSWTFQKILHFLLPKKKILWKKRFNIFFFNKFYKINVNILSHVLNGGLRVEIKYIPCLNIAYIRWLVGLGVVGFRV